MSENDQDDVITFLARAESYGEGENVESIETHISRIFMVGQRAYKLKRAVTLPYADFSTVAQRVEACDKEITLNGRAAPELYRGVRHITRQNGELAFDGAGEMVDAVVEMVRFDQDAILDSMAVAGSLTPKLMSQTARVIADFHADAPVVHDGTGRDNIAGVLDINEAAFAGQSLFEGAAVERLNAAFREALEVHGARLDRRQANGAVRRCHGDLHLRNICVFDGAPQLFDCIEFNEQIATIDVLYDLAFLLMDLWHRDLPALANLVMNRYLDAADEADGVVLLPFFMALRAAVRAHVTATQLEEGGDDDLKETARSYFDLAESLLAASRPMLIAVGGLSGSGKSTVADALAPRIGVAPGARVLESDRTRKSLFGVSVETRLGAEAYTPAVSEQVYGALADRAGVLLDEGCAVVVDAVFDSPARRDALEETAKRCGVPFVGVWLETDPETLRRRVEQRDPGASDATRDVLERQLEKALGAMRWTRLDADAPLDSTLERITALTRDQRA